MPPASVPACSSVSPKAHRRCPLAQGARKRSFCAPVPYAAMGAQPRVVWASTVIPMEVSARLSSSITRE